MKKIILLFIFVSTNAYCGEDLTLVCKGITTRFYTLTKNIKEIPETKTYIFKNGEINYLFGGVVCKWSPNFIKCEGPEHDQPLIGIDRISGVVYEHLKIGGMDDGFKGVCVSAKPKF